MQEVSERPFWQRALFSPLILEKSAAQKIAYIGVMTALCIAVNTFEIKFLTVQYSFTLFMSVLAGILIGPVFGAAAVLLGDGVGYMLSGMRYPYYWWVALSVAVMAIIAGLVIRLPLKMRGSVYVKLALIALLTFAVCSVGINTTGMYYLGLPIYTDPQVLDAALRHFGGTLNYGTYFVIRFFVLLQILNSVVNYALLFAVVPILKAIKPLKLKIE